jgi:SAM-dependent methyltransferase
MISETFICKFSPKHWINGQTAMAMQKEKIQLSRYFHGASRMKLPTNFKKKLFRFILQCFMHPSTPFVLLLGENKRKKLRSFLYLFKNGTGLEIGGGTLLFSEKGAFPIYSLAQSIDGCNFSDNTTWEGKINSDLYMYQGKSLGKQFIAEAVNIKNVVDNNYDFIVSSHCLEHVANPIKALEQWLKALKAGGKILLVLPNKISNFDHKRKYTEFNHLIEDYRRDVDDSDMTHFDEIIAFHDIKRDTGSIDRNFFLERSKNNEQNRCFHHHVFSVDSVLEMFSFLNIKVIYYGKDFHNIYVLGNV